jgi:hypothetical protein
MRLYKYTMLTLSYSIALLLFLSFFQYIKDRYLMVNCQFFIVNYLSHDKPFNVLILSVSILIICITSFNILQKKTTRWSIFVENIGLEPMTLPMYRNAFSQLN